LIEGVIMSKYFYDCRLLKPINSYQLKDDSESKTINAAVLTALLCVSTAGWATDTAESFVRLDTVVFAQASNPQSDPKRSALIFKDSTLDVFALRGDRNVTFHVRRGAQTIELTSPYGYDGANAAARFNDHLIIAATSYESVKGFLLADLVSGKWIDEVWARSVTISPSGRYVAFVAFYPNHGPQPEHQYLVYDATLSPLANRLLGGEPVRQLLEQNHVKNQQGDLYRFYAGAPMVTVQGEEPVRRDEDLDPFEEHRLQSTFVWAPSGDEFAFVELHRGELRVVRVKVGGASVIEAVSTMVLRISSKQKRLLEHRIGFDENLTWTARGLRLRAWEGSDRKGPAAFDSVLLNDQFTPVPQPF
jgi:hypothetical protein